MTIPRRTALALQTLALPFLGTRVLAQPATITLVVGAAPGGTTDALAREAAEALREKLGRNVVVDNRAGAGGNLAASLVARAAPDGGTLLVAFTSHTLNAALMRSLPYRPIEDFTPITLLARLTASVLVVGPSVREPDLASFIAAARATPDKYSFAIGGVGGSLHMQTVMFRAALRLTGPEIPHRGTAPALVDVVGGHVDAMFVPLDVAGPLLADGRVRGLAVTSDAALAALPNLPPLRSAAPEVQPAIAWFGVLGPAGMAPPLVATLHAAIASVLTNPRAIERITSAGGDIPSLTPAAFRTFLERDMAQWIETARLGNIQPQ